MKCAILLLVPALFFVACKTNQMTGRDQLLMFSEEHMNELGAQAYAQATDPGNAPVSDDPRLTAPLLRVGKAISEAADQPDYDWQFKVIDDPNTVNAWALPGGRIAFYTGIYPILQDEAGMAVVMGHEVMHAILQHGNERMSQNATAEIAMMGASIGLGDYQYRNEILAALGMGTQVGLLLPYSRTHESESDKYGLFLAARAGYDPEAAIGVWQRMASLPGERPPEFLSTHPDPEGRIEEMEKLMPEAKRLYEAAPVKRKNRLLPVIKRP